MLSPVDRDVLYHLLTRGDDAPANIADSTGRARANVSQRLSSLSDDGYVRSKGAGVWTLTLKGVSAAHEVARDRESDE